MLTHSASFVAHSRRPGQRTDHAHAFVQDPSERALGLYDDLADEKAEDSLMAAHWEEAVSQWARELAMLDDPEGPFIASPARTRFARGTDESRPNHQDSFSFAVTAAWP